MPQYLTLDELASRVSINIEADSRSQKEIAEAAGMHQPNVSRVLHQRLRDGQKDRALVLDLARLYGIDVSGEPRYAVNVKNDESP